MTRHKVYLCHTPGVLSDSVADMAMALLLACDRKIVQADRYVREGWANGAPGYPAYGVDLKGKTLGIVGLGRIGFEMAKRCVKGFDMHLIYYLEFRAQTDGWDRHRTCKNARYEYNRGLDSGVSSSLLSSDSRKGYGPPTLARTGCISPVC
jgi:lactate dehydrogenase-like 2-hydroxyacid dehydrogenase